MASKDMTFNCEKCVKVLTKVYMLPCMHNFCAECIPLITKKKNIVCSSCLQSHNNQQVKRNKFLEKLISLKRNDVDKNNFKCELCNPDEDIKPAEKYCVECSQNMCNRCALSHLRAKSSANHKIKNIAEMNNKFSHFSEPSKKTQEQLKQNFSEIIKGRSNVDVINEYLEFRENNYPTKDQISELRENSEDTCLIPISKLDLEHDATSVCIIENKLYTINCKDYFLHIYQLEEMKNVKYLQKIDVKNFINQMTSEDFKEVIISEIICVSELVILNIAYYDRMSSIYKFQPCDESFVEIKTLENCNLSSTKEQTILAATWQNELIEFSLNGDEIKTFDVPDEVNLRYITTAHQLNNKKYIVTLFNFESAVISLLDANGNFLKYFIKKSYANYISVATDEEKYIFVLEVKSGKLTILTTELEFISKIRYPRIFNVTYNKEFKTVNLLGPKNVTFYKINYFAK